MFLTKEERAILIKIEYLVMSKNRVKMMKDLDKKGVCYFDDEEITSNDINTYWNIIEKKLQAYDKLKAKSRNYNANNKYYHNLKNKYYYAKKKNNIDLIKQYEEEIAEYKKNKGVKIEK